MPGIDKKLKKVNPRKTITNKQSGIDGPSRTVKKYDASDFSTNKKPKDMLAIKGSPKKSVKGMKNTFAADTTAKRKLKNTFAADTTAKRTPKKDTSDFAGSNKPKVALPKSRPSSIKPKVKVKTPKNVSQGSTMPKKTSVKTPKNVSQGSTMSKKTLVKTPKNVSQGSTMSKNTPKKKLSFFEKIMSETKRNFSGDIKKGTGRYKSLSTGKTNFNKKKKKLPKQISV
jgi:hypothetical protein